MGHDVRSVGTGSAVPRQELLAPDDIPLIAGHFVARHARTHGRPIVILAKFIEGASIVIGLVPRSRG